MDEVAKTAASRRGTSSAQDDQENQQSQGSYVEKSSFQADGCGISIVLPGE
jgi:hypothetical protein